MVKVTFFQNEARDLVGFDCFDHAEYSDGQDIVCAAVSALVITCMNSIETLTEDRFTCKTESETGDIQFRLAEGFGEKSQLLLQSLALGLEEIEENYNDYLDVIFEEVKES